MNKLPKSIIDLATALSSLPGIGPKMGNRLAIYMATSGKNTGGYLQKALADVEANVSICSICGNLTEETTCDICNDTAREQTSLLIVETPMDLLQIEQTGEYIGRYIVLGRLISPINGVGPAEINISLVSNFIETYPVKEVILALSPSVEGEATSLYLTNLIKQSSSEIRVSRLARGLPTGVGIEYLDRETLKGALEGRREFA